MKKTLLVAVILFSFFSVKAQNETIVDPYQKNNELKLNVISPLSGSIEATYERLLNKKSSLGISFLTVYDDTINDDLNYYISPYYRRYFGKKYASGFFAEGFGMLTSIDGKKIYDSEDHSKFTENPDVTDGAIGVGLGGKWLTKSGFVFEINAGYGFLLFNANKTNHNIVNKIGLNVGYRF
ncbi:Protein of unknown function [Flavobacterium aquidurense]|uniref:DUF3575 domain-containing protein n=1 Tax=Flavobacterium frigidimaris TaxID=262320 RepID=A0ABX4BUH3_FLAFR|nr:DUF3575 domain-containing protein [Flavobacterium frigidimaris]OXA81299.1 DUF3575 domain-containing protein [Flavobacterium frigidimaris]SDZ00656.1 Protein of unknown function [Flavobacterium aquidurense]